MTTTSDFRRAGSHEKKVGAMEHEGRPQQSPRQTKKCQHANKPGSLDLDQAVRSKVHGSRERDGTIVRVVRCAVRSPRARGVSSARRSTVPVCRLVGTWYSPSILPISRPASISDVLVVELAELAVWERCGIVKCKLPPHSPLYTSTEPNPVLISSLRMLAVPS